MLLNIFLLFLGHIIHAQASPGPEVTTRALGPAQPSLYACSNSLNVNGNLYTLQETSSFSQYVQCVYYRYRVVDSVQYCWYDFSNRTLYHYPNTPQPVDSNPACPTTLPFAQDYKITLAGTGECITAAGNYDGAPLITNACGTRPFQSWHFNGPYLQAIGTDKCIDLTNGNGSNGARLQVWTCSEGNPNQQFRHWDTTYIYLPEEHISWLANSGLCFDNTNGFVAEGNPVQMWSCNFQSPNQ
ncbi:carbohydrate-binding module family 13 protein [Sphaerobolus stellatus SS14]|nr:carbohydrate-binding module family 13 protein [Sphaerobolus stellatus SS14]